jgi:ethanolamine permease
LLPLIVTLFLSVMAVNLVGLELPRGVQMITTVLATGFLTFAGIVGAIRPGIPGALGASQLTADLWLSVPAATGLAVFLYMGFEWVTPLGLRPSSYQRKVPASLAISVGVLIVAYGAFVLGAAKQMPREVISATPVPQVAYLKALYGGAGTYLALALAVSATISTFNAGVMGGARLMYLLSREGNLPHWCSAISLRTGAPFGAVLLLGTLSLLSGVAVLIWEAVQLVAVIGAAIICVLYAALLLSVLVLRRRRPDHPRPYRSRVWPPLQWFGVIGLPILGFGTLLSEPSLGAKPIYGGLIALAVSGGLALLYGAPRDQAPARAPAPSL